MAKVVTARREAEGAGFVVARPFPGDLAMAEADPFLLLDHVGPQVNGPGEAKGAPWHPHRGFETVSYILDGEIAHHDTNGGGGVIAEGDTQWMTAGGGILHDELPTEQAYRTGGPFHAVQLWVNLPPDLKMTPPRYQSITRDDLRLLTSDDGGALIRLIAGDLAGFAGPGVDPHPDHLRPRDPGARRPALGAVEPGVHRLRLRADRPRHGRRRAPSRRGRPARRVRPRRSCRRGRRRAARPSRSTSCCSAGCRSGAPIAHYGPFVMNTREEILQAIEDYQAGRLGIDPRRPARAPELRVNETATSPPRDRSTR